MTLIEIFKDVGFCELRTSVIDDDTWSIRAKHETETGNLVNYEFRRRVYLYDANCDLITELEPDEDHIHHSHEPCEQRDGESVLEALNRVNGGDIEFIVVKNESSDDGIDIKVYHR